MSRRPLPHQPARYIGRDSVHPEADAAFKAAVMSCMCPACGLGFTAAAIEWADAWREGYVDCIRRDGSDIRDGPYKLRCEMCGRRSLYNVFTNTVVLVPAEPGGGPEA